MAVVVLVEAMGAMVGRALLVGMTLALVQAMVELEGVYMEVGEVIVAVVVTTHMAGRHNHKLFLRSCTQVSGVSGNINLCSEFSRQIKALSGKEHLLEDQQEYLVYFFLFSMD